LENSCHDRGDRGRPLRRRNSFAKQKIRYGGITGNSAEFLHRSERARRNAIHRPGRKFSGDKLSADKSANSIINGSRVEFRIVARIF
jgi:hypothetical protein